MPVEETAKCPQCGSQNGYQDGVLWTCPDCAHEWDPAAPAAPTDDASAGAGVRDAHGNPLADGDTVSVIKDLKVRGSSAVVKVGTKVKGIRLVESTDGHNIACRIDGIGAMNLKSEFVKKA